MRRLRFAIWDVMLLTVCTDAAMRSLALVRKAASWSSIWWKRPTSACAPDSAACRADASAGFAASAFTPEKNWSSAGARPLVVSLKMSSICASCDCSVSSWLASACERVVRAARKSL